MKNQKNKTLLSTCLLIFLAALILSGCIDVAKKDFFSRINLLKGEYYLSNEKYQDGIAAFEKEIKRNPDIEGNHYYLGRFFLAEKKYSKAAASFKKAIALKPNIDEYHFWLGITYSGQKKYKAELNCYRKAILLNPKNYKAHTYSGHNLFRSKKYSKALGSYKKALRIKPDYPSALYNSGLILYRLKRFSEARKAFTKYIEIYKYSPRAVTATAYLNQTGNFEYRIHLINKRKIALKKISFNRTKTGLTKDSLYSVQRIGRIIKKNPEFTLHILSYQKGNKTLAKQKAVAVKNYLLRHFTTIENKQIKISWFSSPETIRIGKKRFTLNDSINFFAIKQAVK